MKKLKIFIALLVVLFLFAIVGQYLGGYIFMQYGHIHNDSLSLTTLYKYWFNGQTIKHNKAYLIGVIISGLLPLATLIVFMAAAFNKPKRELHGSARFATLPEIVKANLLKSSYKEPDILIGQTDKGYLRWSGKQFAFLAAPTRSGKGVGIVIPNCLHYRDSLVVFDPKLENFKITGGYRKDVMKQEVYLFNPSTQDLCSHGWNPLFYIPRDPLYSAGEANNLANILYSTSGGGDSGGNSKFFNEMAQKLFVGLVLYLLETEESTGIVPTMAALNNLTTPANGTPLADWIKEECQRDDLSMACKNGLLSYAGNSAATASGILSSLVAPLTAFNEPIVAAVTGRNDFDLRDVRKKPMTIYLGIQPNDIAKFERLINLFFSQLISLNTAQLPEDNPKELKHQCLLLMDEFAAMGKVDIIQKGVAYIAGYNIRLLTIFQNMSQLNQIYTKDGARSLSTNFECQIIYPPRDQEDAKEYSEIIGYETFKSSSFSRNRGGMTNSSTSISDQKRHVMLPQELTTMPTTECIISMTGISPILAKKIVYYQDPIFKKRLGFTPPEIPALDIKGIKKIQHPELETLADLISHSNLFTDVIISMIAPDYNPKIIDSIKASLVESLDEDTFKKIEKVFEKPKVAT